MKNHWTSSKHKFVTWEMEFKPFEVNIEKLIEFQSEVLNAAEEAQVFRIVKSRLSSAINSRDTYIAHMQRSFREEKILHFFDGLSGIKTETYTQLSYFDENDNIISSEIADMKTLIINLRNLTERTPYSYQGAPLQIWGFSTPLNDLKANPEKPVNAYISLYTDIWFPEVIGYMEHFFVETKDYEIFDNSELAAIHTPRLNRFLARSCELTLAYGGVWHTLPGNRDEIYKQVITETGIQLD